MGGSRELCTVSICIIFTSIVCTLGVPCVRRRSGSRSERSRGMGTTGVSELRGSIVVGWGSGWGRGLGER